MKNVVEICIHEKECLHPGDTNYQQTTECYPELYSQHLFKIRDASGRYVYMYNKTDSTKLSKYISFNASENFQFNVKK